ncbi:hypothetical protein WH52_06505 [Tenacibaculum holothuriorum]|uniref:HNH endonuclease 5 domain-containing protein n=1 Tax=Tenacibaculum holothuriorum TaxID=1635173 RepID=A0A1Y2PD46_9FLAO|nr:hypothetical protein [Tenacibaculum holothuriorum]OSY88406.1 hypothetical protein WH52_06505 [Tenacibaculum holothuriorum]
MKKKIKGICRICKEEKELSFEHIPPRSSFNKGRWQSIPSSKYYQNLENFLKEDFKYKGKIKQGGIGEYSLCIECNNQLGANYVNEYKKFSHIAMSIISEEKHSKVKCFQFDISDINHLYFLKQIIAIFVSANSPEFTESYPELLDFIKDKESNLLPNRYRIYMYLNNEGQIKNGKFSFTNKHGVICEFTYPPFGFVLSIDNPNRIMEVSEITNFKYYNEYIKKLEKAPIMLNKYPTYYPFPLDFRELNESM